MHSMNRDPWIAALLAKLDDASFRGASFDELMALFDSVERLRAVPGPGGYG